jgi:hypothetical protein
MTKNEIKSIFINNAIVLLDIDYNSLYSIFNKYHLLKPAIILTTRSDAINYINSIDSYYNFCSNTILATIQNASNDIKSATLKIKKINQKLSLEGIETVDIIKRKIYEYTAVINKFKNNNHLNREAQVKAYDQYLNPSLYSSSSTQTETEYKDTQLARYKIFTLNWQENSEKIARLESEKLQLQRKIAKT